MSFEYIRKAYGVPAEIGRRVTVDGKPGIIVAHRGHYLGVNFDSDKPSTFLSCHPTWRVEYGEIGKIRKVSKSAMRYQHYLEVGDCFDNFKHFLNYHYGKKVPQ